MSTEQSDVESIKNVMPTDTVADWQEVPITPDEDGVKEDGREHVTDGSRCWCDPDIEIVTKIEDEVEMPLFNKEELLRIDCLNFAVRFAASLSGPDGAVSTDQIKAIANTFVDYIKGDTSDAVIE